MYSIICLILLNLFACVLVRYGTYVNYNFTIYIQKS